MGLWRPRNSGDRALKRGTPDALVASLVDPWFKFGPGFSDVDKNYIWNIIRQMMTHIAVGELQRERSLCWRKGDSNSNQEEQA
jgi:hypothetical protein